MKQCENCHALPVSDSRDRLGKLFLRDQIGSLNSLHEATIEPERDRKHHVPIIITTSSHRRLRSRIN